MTTFYFSVVNNTNNKNYIYTVDSESTESAKEFFAKKALPLIIDATYDEVVEIYNDQDIYVNLTEDIIDLNE